MMGDRVDNHWQRNPSGETYKTASSEKGVRATAGSLHRLDYTVCQPGTRYSERTACNMSCPSWAWAPAKNTRIFPKKPGSGAKLVRKPGSLFLGQRQGGKKLLHEYIATGVKDRNSGDRILLRQLSECRLCAGKLRVSFQCFPVVLDGFVQFPGLVVGVCHAVPGIR